MKIQWANLTPLASKVMQKVAKHFRYPSTFNRLWYKYGIVTAAYYCRRMKALFEVLESDHSVICVLRHNIEELKMKNAILKKELSCYVNASIPPFNPKDFMSMSVERIGRDIQLSATSQKRRVTLVEFKSLRDQPELARMMGEKLGREMGVELSAFFADELEKEFKK